jgi:hypothetical protein
MERWERIERYVLLVVGIALLSFCAWLGIMQTGPERFVWIALLTPCTFWVFWQALFEDKLKSGEPLSKTERVMWATWLWLRRVVFGTIAIAFGLCVAYLLIKGEIRSAALLAFLSAIVAWVATYGGGHYQSMSDDRKVHEERMKRYK